MTSPPFYIKILIFILFILGIIYIFNSESQKRETPLLDFIREPTPQDVQPMLEVGDLDDNKREEWWYGTVLNGDDGLMYVIEAYIDNIPRIRYILKELDNEASRYATIECLNFDRQKTAQGVIINCSQQDGRRLRVEVRTPDNSELSFSFTPNETLQLNFKSRGLPHWFKNGFGFRSGFEDLSTVSGVLTKGGEKIQLEGYGIFERVLFDLPQYRTISYKVWSAINFDQGYVFLFESKSRGGYTTKSAAVSINGKYSYVNDPTKITIEHTIENQIEKENNITIETDDGKLEISGTLIGFMDFQPILIHGYNGHFTHNNGDILELSGGMSISHCLSCK